MESTFNMPLWVSIPFLIMLLAIAVGPLILGKWWDKNKNKLLVSIILSIPVVVYILKVLSIFYLISTKCLILTNLLLFYEVGDCLSI
jgi:hypothetical protein